jgi:hypothetical protein
MKYSRGAIPQALRKGGKEDGGEGGPVDAREGGAHQGDGPALRESREEAARHDARRALRTHRLQPQLRSARAARAGFCEVDLVAPQSGYPRGEFAHSACAADVASGWTEFRVVPSRARKRTIAAHLDVRASLPFALLGLALRELLPALGEDHRQAARGRRVRQRHNRQATPSARLLALGALKRATATRLEEQHPVLNPGVRHTLRVPGGGGSSGRPRPGVLTEQKGRCGRPAGRPPPELSRRQRTIKMSPGLQACTTNDPLPTVGRQPTRILYVAPTTMSFVIVTVGE